MTRTAEVRGAKKPGPRAFCRTNLGRAAARRREIISAHAGGAGAAGASWRDVPMQKNGDGWQIELPLAEVGFFKAKAYLLDEKNWQHWPDGPDVGISVHPNFRPHGQHHLLRLHAAVRRDQKSRRRPPTKNWTRNSNRSKRKVTPSLPPSGKFRDLARQLPHIVNKLGCRILHLLPVHPTPTTYARFGRFGSPYAALDLTAD